MCDMHEPCEFLSLDGCQMRFLLAHKEVDLTLHPLVVLCLEWEMRRTFRRRLISKAWILFSELASRVHVSQPKRIEATRDLDSLNLLLKLMVLLCQVCQVLFILAIAEACLMQSSTEQVASLHWYFKLLT